MIRVLASGELYEPVRLREDEFESVLAARFRDVVPDWHWLDCKPLLTSPYGGVRPDAILVSDSRNQWWVVEVELVSHPESHYDDQFRKLSSAKYGSEVIEALGRGAGGSILERAKQVVRSGPPELLCVADGLSSALARVSRGHGFEYVSCAPLRSTMGSYALVIEQLPRSLATPPSHVTYQLEPTGVFWGGRMSATLPRTFPTLQSITIRFGDVLHQAPILNLRTSRTVMLPEGYSLTKRGTPILKPVDPAIGLYSLEEGRQ